MASKKKTSVKDTWGEWGNHVLLELERLNDNIEKMQIEVTKSHADMWAEITTLKVKSGLWGLIGGILAVIPSLIFFWLKKS
jgi:hypothetical protein